MDEEQCRPNMWLFEDAQGHPLVLLDHTIEALLPGGGASGAYGPNIIFVRTRSGAEYAIKGKLEPLAYYLAIMTRDGRCYRYPNEYGSASQFIPNDPALSEG